MTTYFTKLFNYDRHANNVMIDTILSSGITTGKPVELMAHLLAAQQQWLARCKQQPAPGGGLWPNWAAENLRPINEQNHQEWMAYLNNLKDNDLKQTIAYKNSAGVNYSNPLTDILTHVVNHGTHHRAQAGQHLKLAGVEKLPATDYIFYIREQ